MTLLEAFKCCSIENLDEEELIFDCDYYAYDEDHDKYDLFVHNLKELSMDETFEKYNSLELSDEVKESLKSDGGEDYYDEDIRPLIVGAAWLTYNDVELPVEDDDALVVEEVYNYEIICAKADLNIQVELDLDMSQIKDESGYLDVPLASLKCSDYKTIC